MMIMKDKESVVAWDDKNKVRSKRHICKEIGSEPQVLLITPRPVILEAPPELYLSSVSNKLSNTATLMCILLVTGFTSKVECKLRLHCSIRMSFVSFLCFLSRKDS